MNHDEIYAAMASIAKKAMKRGLLQSHMDDFSDQDRTFLEKNWTPEGRFIWVISPYGTHLTEIGLHPDSNAWALRSVHSGHRHIEIYLISSKGVQLITPQKAESLIDQGFEYAVDGSLVRCKHGEEVASMRISPNTHLGQHTCAVRFKLSVGQACTRRLKHVLEAIAAHETHRHFGTFFAMTESVAFE